MTDMSFQASLPAQRPSFAMLLARFGLLILLVAVIAAFTWLKPNFADTNNVNLVLRSVGISMVMFLGLTWVIASGKIDVSFMEVAALTTMVVATAVVAGWSWGAAALAGLCTGIVVGSINGILIGYLGMPPLITTIATGTGARSLAWVLGAGASLPINARGPVADFLTINVGVVPLVTIGAIAFYLLAWFAQERLVFGQYLYAMEQNERAVIEAGIPARRLTVLLFVISSICASVAGILLTANLSSGQPGLGASYFLDGLTAVLLGGMAFKPGKPNVAGTCVGILFLAVLVSGGAMLGWSNYAREIIKGCLLLFGISAVLLVRHYVSSRSR